MPQDLRRERQRKRRESGVIPQIQKHRKLLVGLIGGAGLGDLLKDAIRSRMMDWALVTFGHYSKWILRNPFFVLTIVAAGVVVWVLWIFVEASFASESLLVGATGEPVYRQQVSARFVAGFFVVSLICLVCMAYGGYRYATVPDPFLIGLHDAWYATNLHNADVYVNVNLENYSDKQVKVHVDGGAFEFGKAIPANKDDMGYFYTLVPGALHAIHFPMELNLGDLAHAFGNDAITVVLTASYNDGKRDVVYTYEGRVIAESQGNCFRNSDGRTTCKGIVDSLRSEWN